MGAHFYDGVGDRDGYCHEYEQDHYHNTADDKDDNVIYMNMFMTLIVTMTMIMLLVMDDGGCRMEK